MTPHTVSSILLVLVAAAVSPAPTRAQEAALTGSFRLVPEQSDRVEDAVEEATDGAGFFVRTVGRRVLTGKLKPVGQIRIVVTDSLMVLGSEKDTEGAIRIVEAPGDPAAGPVRGGEASAAVAWWEGAVLSVRFAEDEGTRIYRYALDPDGRTLRVEVRVSGDKLPRPVELWLTYQRQVQGMPEDTASQR